MSITSEMYTFPVNRRQSSRAYARACAAERRPGDTLRRRIARYNRNGIPVPVDMLADAIALGVDPTTLE